MARKDVFKGALEALINPSDPPARSQSKSILQTGALGAVESGLARSLQLLDLDPDQIERSEFEDRLPHDSSNLVDLIDSMRTHGQQIPILVQRIGPDEYRVIYGRRRIAAARALGQKVRALITQMDDEQRIIAQGIENTVRQDLSFIEKAMFAHRLREAEIPDATIRASLNIDVGAPKATTLSTMKMVVETLGEDLIQAIGRAPGIGRPRWRALAETFRDNAARFAGKERSALLSTISESAGFASANQQDPEADDPSDERFKLALRLISTSSEQPPAPENTSPVRHGERLVATVKRTRGAVTMTVKAKDNPEFHAWVQENAEKLLKAMHDKWSDDDPIQPPKEAR